MKKGVMLVNLGTPKAPTVKAIRQFLGQFLSDRRVVDLSPIIWYPILYGVILPLRARRIQGNYQKIWFSAQAPLQYYMEQLCEKLQQRHPEWHIELAMTYGEPSIAKAMDNLQQQGLSKWVALPLYPQYSSTTTEPVWDQIKSYLDKQPTNKLPQPITVYDYAEHPSYIQSLKITIEQAIQQYGEPDLFLLSYHGIPLRYVINGDSYAKRCELTTQALQQQLPAVQHKITMSYQSRFGREVWLQPYTDKLLAKLPANGVKKIFVLCPGFSIDCLETLEEIAQENRQHFLNSGGEAYYYIPALNDSELQLTLCDDLIHEAFCQHNDSSNLKE